ncbi:MAG: GntR family transcriptional regulator [Acidimicrobiales bacterium]
MNASPLYLTVAETLIDRIEAGSLAPGDRIASERALAREFGVNRQTVRQALDVLSSRGLVERVRGSGSYVKEPRLQRGAAEFFHFTERMTERNLAPTSKIMGIERLFPSTKIAGDLELAPRAEVFRIHRLRSIDGHPIVLETFSTPVELAPDLENLDLGNRSFYEILRTEYDIHVEYSRQSLEAVALSETEAHWLVTLAGAPAMLERRVSFDQRGQPVESGTDLYRGDRVRFNTEAATVSLFGLAPRDNKPRVT